MALFFKKKISKEIPNTPDTSIQAFTPATPHERVITAEGWRRLQSKR